MINSVLKFKSHCIFIYYLTFYSFFTSIGYKKFFADLDIKIEDQISLPSYSHLEANSKEIKILLDLKYKNSMKFMLQDNHSFYCVLDMEGKVLGRKINTTQIKKITPSNVDFTMHLNRKFLHSTLFGSIKLIKI
nr:hypothetical protein [Cryptomonas curvata]